MLLAASRRRDLAPCNTIRRVTCPVLLIHGEDDRSVSPADARQIYANRADDSVQLLLLPDTDHDSGAAISVHGVSLLAFLRRSVGLRSR